VLHDIGEQEGVDFLVMEYLEGETLADRLLKGPLPAEQCIRYATEIADALDRAHKHGIVHRDLKPGNVMLTKAGAKVLDFGLAKGQTPAMAASAMTAMVTQTKPLTAEGSIVGTFQYMAPETLEGNEADARSDIFSFGALLYEMLTGRRAFSGKTQASVIAAVLASEPPPISGIQPMTPPALDRLVRTCLAKDPDERFQSAHDLVLQLRWIADAGSQAGVPAPVVVKRKHRERIAWALAGVALAAAAALGTMYWRALGEKPMVVRALISESGAHLLSTGDNGGPVVVSPDGNNTVYLAMDQNNRPLLWVRSTSSLNGTPLAGTEDAKFPFWSFDSKSVGYFQNAKLRVSDIAGNPPVSVADAPDGRGGSWAADGTILFAPDTRATIVRVSASGGTPAELIPIGKGFTTNRWPQALPDGKHFLYFAGDHNNLRSETAGIYYASLDGKENRLLVRTFAGGQYADGYLLFLRENALFAQRFDAEKGKLLGEAQAIAQSVNFDITTWKGVFSASDHGLLVYQMSGGALGTKIQWFDRTGKLLGTEGGAAAVSDLQLSPDGKRIATGIGDAASEIWVIDLARGTRSRLTFQGAPNLGAIWSPDGKQLVFMSGRGSGHFDLYVKAADGSTEEQRLLPPGKTDRLSGDWTRDGKYIVYDEGSASGDLDIYAVPLAGERKPFKVIGTPFFDTDPVVSPDGKWIAYDSNPNGRSDVFVSHFPDGTGKWQISASAGGSVPRWSPDGKELFYIAPDRTIMRVAVGVNGNSFEPGPPTALFRSTAVSAPVYSYQLAPDGKRFLMNSMDEQGSLPMVVVVNWKADLKK
jgi:Tol biopolymer transport system component